MSWCGRCQTGRAEREYFLVFAFRRGKRQARPWRFSVSAFKRGGLAYDWKRSRGPVWCH